MSWDGDNLKETLAKSPGVHIRYTDSMDTYCGQPGSTISLEHYRKDPSGHASTLSICEACLHLQGCDCEARGSVSKGFLHFSEGK